MTIYMHFQCCIDNVLPLAAFLGSSHQRKLRRMLKSVNVCSCCFIVTLMPLGLMQFSIWSWVSQVSGSNLAMESLVFFASLVSLLVFLGGAAFFWSLHNPQSRMQISASSIPDKVEQALQSDVGNIKSQHTSQSGGTFLSLRSLLLIIRDAASIAISMKMQVALLVACCSIGIIQVSHLFPQMELKTSQLSKNLL